MPFHYRKAHDDGAHGNYQMSMSGNDRKCKHPPIGKCESAHKARSKAYASIRPVGREASDDMQ
jgi:hypothetical protein